MARRNQYLVDLGYDDEMGFASRLFLNEFSGGFHSSSLRRDPYVSDTLSDQFSSLSLLRPKPRSCPPPLPSCLLQPSRPQGFSSVNNLSNVGHYQKVYRARPKLTPSITDPFYELRLSRLRKNELEQERARVLERQEARLHKEGLVHRNGNVLKESKGTGVFHPIQRPSSMTAGSVYKRKADRRNWNQREKEILIRGKRGVMTTSKQPQQQQEECHYHLPSDMDFSSEDWTF